MDSFGSWYNATVISINDDKNDEKDSNADSHVKRKEINVTLKVYNKDGNKIDEETQKKYFGFADYNETFCVYSAEIAPYCSVAKEFNYDSSKSQFDYIDDYNDMVFREWNN